MDDRMESQYGSEWGNVRMSLGSNVLRQGLRQSEDTSQGLLEGKGRKSIGQSITEGRSTEAGKKRGAERKSEIDRADARLSGVSERTKEVLQSLLGDLGNGELYQNLMRKLESNATQMDTEHRLDNDINQNDYNQENGLENLRSVDEELRHSTGMYGLEQTTSKSIVSRKEGTGLRSDLEDDLRADARKGIAMGLEGEHTLGLRSEKYVSVNMIKRILDANQIYAEDIVDEIFRYLGENLVNKNYFAQIIGV